MVRLWGMIEDAPLFHAPMRSASPGGAVPDSLNYFCIVVLQIPSCPTTISCPGRVEYTRIASLLSPLFYHAQMLHWRSQWFEMVRIFKNLLYFFINYSHLFWIFFCKLGKYPVNTFPHFKRIHVTLNRSGF